MQLLLCLTTLLVGLMSSTIIAVATALPSTRTMHRRQDAFVNLNVGLGSGIESSLAGLAQAEATGGDPTPWIQDMQNQFETAVTAIAVVKPEANAPDKDDIIDLCVKIVLDVVFGLADVPLTAALLLAEPGLDNAMSQWILAMGNAIPGSNDDIGNAIPSSDYTDLLNLKLFLSLDALGLGGLLEGLGL